jgi:hypothetical protein
MAHDDTPGVAYQVRITLSMPGQRLWDRQVGEDLRQSRLREIPISSLASGRISLSEETKEWMPSRFSAI